MLAWIQTASRTTIAVGVIAMAVVLFLSINLITSLTIVGTRLDVTDQQLFTLTDDTRAILEAIDEPITLRLYLSSDLVNAIPEIRVHSEQVIELLKTYEIVSGGKVDFKQFDPVPLSVEEDEALGLGLLGFPLSVNDRGYFGLVGTNALDSMEIIRFFDPDQTAALEYDLTRLVSRLSSQASLNIGVLDGLGVFGAPGDTPSQFVQRLQAEFTVTQLDLDINNIPAFDAIVVIHPFGLIEQARYAIDQYIIRGGTALILLDTFAERSLRSAQVDGGFRFPDSYLEPLLGAWGVGMLADQIVGDPALALTVQSADGRQVAWYEQMVAVEGNFDLDDIVTAPLVQVRITSPGALYQLPGATTQFTPLITTTEFAGLIPQSTATSQNPLFSQQAFVPADGPHVLAARITGTVRTAYPNGPPQQVEGNPTPPPTLIEESVQPFNVIIVADTDLIADDHLSGNFRGASNAIFIVNALEELGGAANLTRLRSRQAVARPFTRIRDLLEEANALYGARMQALNDELADLAFAIDDMLARTPLRQEAALSPDLRVRYDQMVAQQIQDRRELRDLEAAVRSDFDSLRTNLRLINILVIPGIVIVFGLLVAIWRRARLSRYLAGRQTAG